MNSLIFWGVRGRGEGLVVRQLILYYRQVNCSEFFFSGRFSDPPVTCHLLGYFVVIYSLPLTFFFFLICRVSFQVVYTGRGSANYTPPSFSFFLLFFFILWQTNKNVFHSIREISLLNSRVGKTWTSGRLQRRPCRLSNKIA